MEIDQNSHVAGLGYTPDIDQVFPLLVNPATGELLVEIIPVASDGTAISTRNIPVDGNGRQASAAVLDSTEKIIPLTVDVIQNVNCLRIDANLV